MNEREASERLMDCPNPECQNTLKLKRGPTDFGKVIRNCYECFARITYDLDANSIDGWTKEEPLTLNKAQIADWKATCPYRSWTVTFKETRNSKDQWVQYCPNCTKLILVQE